MVYTLHLGPRLSSKMALFRGAVAQRLMRPFLVIKAKVLCNPPSRSGTATYFLR